MTGWLRRRTRPARKRLGRRTRGRPLCRRHRRRRRLRVPHPPLLLPPPAGDGGAPPPLQGARPALEARRVGPLGAPHADGRSAGLGAARKCVATQTPDGLAGDTRGLGGATEGDDTASTP